MENNKLILDFLSGKSSDHVNRYIDDILAFSDYEIEINHDFIQWIFPTKRASELNSLAPTISSEFKYCFTQNKRANVNFCKTCLMFLHFCGLTCHKEINNNTDTKKLFIYKPQHNLLRISRVLDSLNQVGYCNCAKNVYNQLMNINNQYPNQIPNNTLGFCKNIISNGDE